jgi:hypothetical protein
MPPESTRATTLELPSPANDWIDQSQVGGIFGVTAKTASLWAKAGRLSRYEHGMPNCGRRKYSRQLVMQDLKNHWSDAVSRFEQHGAPPIGVQN